jgi:hypothetical protein
MPRGVKETMHRSGLYWSLLKISLLFVPLFAYFGLNYSGFCFAQMRCLSDQEQIKLVFGYQNNRQTLFIPGKGNVEHIPYENFEQYAQSYPDCCAVNPGGAYGVPPANFFDRIFGYDSNDIVVINFYAHYYDEFGHQRIEKIQFENVLTNCGHPRY